MALREVWQLQKLIVNYCDWAGSSRGIRAFMESHLPPLKDKNPQLEVVTELIRGQHPLLKGFYEDKNQRVIRVRNMDPGEATKLRNALGRKIVKLKTRHETKHARVQGTWTTAVKFYDAKTRFMRSCPECRFKVARFHLVSPHACQRNLSVFQ